MEGAQCAPQVLHGIGGVQGPAHVVHVQRHRKDGAGCFGEDPRGGVGEDRLAGPEEAEDGLQAPEHAAAVGTRGRERGADIVGDDRAQGGFATNSPTNSPPAASGCGPDPTTRNTTPIPDSRPPPPLPGYRPTLTKPEDLCSTPLTERTPHTPSPQAAQHTHTPHANPTPFARFSANVQVVIARARGC